MHLRMLGRALNAPRGAAAVSQLKAINHFAASKLIVPHPTKLVNI